jgi:hypothetical protein
MKLKIFAKKFLVSLEFPPPARRRRNLVAKSRPRREEEYADQRGRGGGEVAAEAPTGC